MKKLSSSYLFFILVIIFYTIGNLYLILSNYLDGGHGDSPHRILFTYDFLDYDFERIFQWHLLSLWPPFPFIIQANFFKLLKIFDFGLVSSIYILSLLIAIIHLIIIFWFFKKNQKTILGIIYIIFFTTSGSLNLIFISSMPEIYALSILSFSLIIYNRKINLLLVILLGFIFFLATLCRSEIIFLSLSFFLVLFFFSKKKYSLVFLLISFFPFVIKNIFFLINDFNPDSNSITMGNLYNFGSLYDRFYNFLSEIAQFIKWQNFIGSIFVLSLFIFISFKKIKTKFLKKNSLIFILAIIYLILMLLLFAFGPITQNLRYLFIPLLITFIGFILIFDKKIEDQYLRIFKNKLFFFYLFTFVGLLLNFYFLTKSTSKEIRQAKNFLIMEIKNSKMDINKPSALLIDHLLGYEMYFMMHAIIQSNNNYAASQYDMRPSPRLDPLVEQTLIDKKNSIIELKMLAYINEFKPMYLITAGDLTKSKLENLQFIINTNERSSYIIPNSNFDKLGNLELNFIKIQKNNKIYYKKIFSNNQLNIFKIITD